MLLGFVYVSVDASLQLPDYMAKIINEGVVLSNTDKIYHYGLIMLIVAFVGAAATVCVGFLASRIASGFSRDLRDRVFARVESFSLVEFNQFSTASLITRSTNDIQQIQMVLVLMLRMVLQAPVTGIWAIVKAYHLAPSLSWVIVLAVSILFIIISTLFIVALPKFQLLQKLIDRLNLVTRENLTGLRVIRAFNNEKLEQEKFDRANIDLTATTLFVNRLMVIMQPIMMLVFNLTAVAIVWFGAHQIGAGSLEVGNMIAFMQYAMQVIMSFLMISIIFILIPRASVSASRVAEVIETEPKIKNPKVGQPSDNSGKVEFREVTFFYPGADTPALKNISFTAIPGEVTAIVGSTGSGKSTLINLIPRFYDATSGEVIVNGVNVKEVKLDDLYSKIGYVPQKAVLFSGTVESNIKYGAPEADDDLVKQAAAIAQADDFIKKLKDQYQGPIAQGGTNVSGGQKQRLQIARAIARDSQIFIFDDSFSALDFKTDAKLRGMLQKTVKNKTVIIVAQRISTIVNAEKIIVLDDGEIVGVGNHSQLIKSCRVYKEIAESQLSEDDLKNYKLQSSAQGVK